jgi:DNA-binding protein H-NS
MQFNDRVVGNVQLPAQAPHWMINLTAAIATVDRSEFLREIDALTAQVRDADRRAAIELARGLVAEFGLHKKDVFAPKEPEREKITAKFRDPVTGNAWSGRGATPSWLQGKNLSEYAVP